MDGASMVGALDASWITPANPN